MGIWPLPVLLARIHYVILPDVAAPDRQAVIPPEGEIHREAVVGRGHNRELALGQEQELNLDLVQGPGLERVQVVLTRTTLNNEFLRADRQEEICRPA